MSNKEVARIFDQIADLLEIKGEDRFRVNSYRRSARTIGDLTEDVAQLANAGKLRQVPGIGKGTAEKVQQFLDNGKVTLHQELLSEIPPGLPGLLAIPGLGPKKVAAAWKQLDVTDRDGLLAAIDTGKLAELPGMGAKTAEKIRHGIEFLERSAGRAPLGVVLPAAQELANQIKVLPQVKRTQIAGSLRRARETIGDVDILCQSTAGKKVVDAFTGFEQVKEVVAAGSTKGTVLVETPLGSDLSVDLRVVPGKSFGAALQYFTGSKEHNVRLREIAIKKGLKLNEYGLFRDEKQVAGADEAEIYAKLGLPHIPPELREDRGEIEAAENLPSLLAVSDIRGDLHAHTTASDGHQTAEELGRFAKDFGHEYVAVADHSKSQIIANGLSLDRMYEQIEVVRAADKRVRGVTILLATEVDILSGGKLDYPDDVLAECDLVIASIHSGLGQDRATVTKRTLAAMDNPYVTIIGHPTGRLLGQREAMDIDMDQVIRYAAKTNTALEVNASWQRLDLKDLHVRQAIDAGVTIAINTDAHSVEHFEDIAYGVQTARRGWATAADVLNARSLPALRKWIARKRAT
jgi:DNA polymerase (family 10)